MNSKLFEALNVNENCNALIIHYIEISIIFSGPGDVATISVHQRLLFTMNKSRCGRNDFCPLDSNR